MDRYTNDTDRRMSGAIGWRSIRSYLLIVLAAQPFLTVDFACLRALPRTVKGAKVLALICRTESLRPYLVFELETSGFEVDEAISTNKRKAIPVPFVHFETAS